MKSTIGRCIGQKSIIQTCNGTSTSRRTPKDSVLPVQQKGTYLCTVPRGAEDTSHRREKPGKLNSRAVKDQVTHKGKRVDREARISELGCVTVPMFTSEHGVTRWSRGLMFDSCDQCEEYYFPQFFTFFNSFTIHDWKERLSTVNKNMETAVFHASCIKIVFHNSFLKNKNGLFRSKWKVTKLGETNFEETASIFKC